MDAVNSATAQARVTSRQCRCLQYASALVCSVLQTSRIVWSASYFHQLASTLGGGSTHCERRNSEKPLLISSADSGFWQPATVQGSVLLLLTAETSLQRSGQPFSTLA